MLIPYMTWGKDLEITHTPLDESGRTKVHFEKPCTKLGLKTFECEIPGYKITINDGCSQKEVEWFIQFVRNNAATLLKYAEAGGFKNA